MTREGFLTRWLRLRAAAGRSGPDEPAAALVAVAEDPAEPELPAVPAEPASVVGSEPQAPSIDLPALDSVSLETGIAAFLRPGVEDGLRRQALKKLFSDPHFNIMDGLDIYIDDYSRSEPIPADILGRLVQAQMPRREQDVEDVPPVDDSTIAASPSTGPEPSGLSERAADSDKKGSPVGGMVAGDTCDGAVQGDLQETVVVQSNA